MTCVAVLLAGRRAITGGDCPRRRAGFGWNADRQGPWTGTAAHR